MGVAPLPGVTCQRSSNERDGRSAESILAGLEAPDRIRPVIRGESRGAPEAVGAPCLAPKRSRWLGEAQRLERWYRGGIAAPRVMGGQARDAREGVGSISRLAASRNTHITGLPRASQYRDTANPWRRFELVLCRGNADSGDATGGPFHTRAWISVPRAIVGRKLPRGLMTRRRRGTPPRGHPPEWRSRSRVWCEGRLGRPAGGRCRSRHCP